MLEHRTAQIVSVDGHELYAEASGDHARPHIVFVHGLGCTVHAFDAQFSDPRMLENLYMVRYDLRGHGRSVKPTTSEAHTGAAYAADFAAVCAEFALVRPVFVGWSWGAMLAADVVAHLPAGTLAGVVTLSGPPDVPSGYQCLQPEYAAIFPRLVAPTGVDGYRSTLLAFADLMFLDPESIPYTTRLAWRGAALLLPPAVVACIAAREQDAAPFWAAGAAGTLPALFMYGKRDRVINGARGAALMYAGFKKCEVVVIEEAGHAFFVERPEQVNTAILRFVKNVRVWAAPGEV